MRTFIKVFAIAFIIIGTSIMFNGHQTSAQAPNEEELPVTFEECVLTFSECVCNGIIHGTKFTDLESEVWCELIGCSCMFA